MTAALVPGAAVFVRPAHACLLAVPDSPATLVPEAEIVLIGRVRAESTRDQLVLEPEAFLKGPVSAEPVRLGSAETPLGGGSDCTRGTFGEGDRVLAFVFDAEAPHYPYLTEAYHLRDGQAYMEGQDPIPEVEAVSSIRAITGQHAVPAASEDEGAGIDWGNTVLPLGVVLAVIFGIGLVLMRVWHRIDPS